MYFSYISRLSHYSTLFAKWVLFFHGVQGVLKILFSAASLFRNVYNIAFLYAHLILNS